jgi:hypothetical protein
VLQDGEHLGAGVFGRLTVLIVDEGGQFLSPGGDLLPPCA